MNASALIITTATGSTSAGRRTTSRQLANSPIKSKRSCRPFFSEASTSPDMDARVLVTGGNGFVGRRLCEALRDRAVEVWAPSRQELDLARDAIPDFPVDKVFHLAARSFVPD